MKFLRGVLITFSVLLVLCGLVTGAYFYNNYLNEHVKLKEYNFASGKLPEAFDGYKIFVISDIHNAPFSDQIIEKIEESNPDLLVFTGDMVQLPDRDLSESIKIADAFKDKIPIYAVSGNHEKQNDDYWELYDEFHYTSNVDWLGGFSIPIEKDGEKIYLAGIDDPGSDFVGKEEKEKIKHDIDNILYDSRGFTVLLSHRPDLYPIIKNRGFNLIISGDLHGGIIRLPFIGGVIGKEGNIGMSDYNYGVVKEGTASTMIVSGGCDQNPLKKRWFNQPEVLLITLESE